MFTPEVQQFELESCVQRKGVAGVMGVVSNPMIVQLLSGSCEEHEEWEEKEEALPRSSL